MSCLTRMRETVHARVCVRDRLTLFPVLILVSQNEIVKEQKSMILRNSGYGVHARLLWGEGVHMTPPVFLKY